MCGTNHKFKIQTVNVQSAHRLRIAPSLVVVEAASRFNIVIVQRGRRGRRAVLSVDTAYLCVVDNARRERGY